MDRIETLVQNLLKITRLDAGSVVLEKKNENVAEMVQDIARQYHYRAEQEQKKLVLSGSEAVTLWCDRDWMQEAVDNLVKNALDHTKSCSLLLSTFFKFFEKAHTSKYCCESVSSLSLKPSR